MKTKDQELVIIATGRGLEPFFIVASILRVANISFAVIRSPDNGLELATLKSDAKKAKRALRIATETIEANTLSKAHQFLYQDN